MENIQTILDLFTQSNKLNFRYILNYYTINSKGFGGLKEFTLNLYRNKEGKSTLITSIITRGKIEEVENLAKLELLNKIVKENLLNYGLE